MATLVVLDETGRVRGITDPIQLAKPWWSEVGPINALMPNAVVLRLLNAKPEDGQKMGGEVTYLVQVDGEFSIELHPWHGKLESHSLRMPWAEAGQAAADMTWVSTHVEIAGTASQCKSWNLSCIWSVPARRCGSIGATASLDIRFLTWHLPIHRVLVRSGRGLMFGPKSCLGATLKRHGLR